MDLYTQSRRRHPLPLLVLLWTVVVSLAVLGLISLYRFALTGPTSPEEIDCNCGSSIAEALSKDCKYDAMATSWLPPACRDDELAAEFDRAGPGPNGEWTYYADQDGNSTYTLNEVALLAEREGDGRAFWTTYEWHVAHCLFYWRKESRARMSGGAFVELSFTGEYHVDHCTEVLKSCRPLDEIDTRSTAGLNSDITDGAV